MSNYIPAVGSNISPAQKPMNCNAWGTYEAPNTSPTAGFCNGGTVDGELWAPCPSQDECRGERNRRSLSDARRLPVVQGQPPRSQVQVVGQPSRPMYPGAPAYPSYGTSGGTTLPQRQPAPLVVVPTHNNPYLDTPRAGGTDHHSPTYVPAPEEHFLRRLLANMVIGAFEAAAHHVSSFLRTVDIFPFKKKQ